MIFDFLIEPIQQLPDAWQGVLYMLIIIGVLLLARWGYMQRQHAQNMQEAKAEAERKHEREMEALRARAADDRAQQENVKTALEMTASSLSSVARVAEDVKHSNNRVADAMDNFAKVREKESRFMQEESKNLQNTIVDLTAVMRDSKNTMLELASEVRSTRAATEATQQTVQDTSKQSQNDMALMTSSMNDVRESMDKMTRSLDSLKDELVNELQKSREMATDEHAKVFNGLQTIRDLIPLMQAVSDKVHDLETISKQNELNTTDDTGTEEAA